MQPRQLGSASVSNDPAEGNAPPDSRSPPEFGVTAILVDLGTGAPNAIDRLFTALYDQLRKVAETRVRISGNGNSALDVSATSVLHETYERMVRLKQLRFEDRAQFFRYAAVVMRTVIVDLARARTRMRRGGDAVEVPLDTILSASIATPLDENVVRMDEALAMLEQTDPRLVQVIEMRFFAGLSVSEIADALGVTERTVGRDWLKAKALLAAIVSAND